MRRRYIVIGLLIAIAAIAAYIAAPLLIQQEVTWTWLRAPNGQPGFALLLNGPAWTWTTGRAGNSLEDGMRSGRFDERLEALVVHGMQNDARGCPHHWLLADVRQLRDGSVFLSGYCATTDELMRARGHVWAKYL